MNRTISTLVAGAVCVTLILLLNRAIPSFKAPEPASEKGHVSESHAMNQRGVAFLEQGEYDKAVKVLRHAKEIQPRDSIITENLSLGLARLSGAAKNSVNTDRKKKLLKESLSLWPENPEALTSLSRLYYEEGRYEDAWNLAVRLAAFNPDIPRVHEYIARLEKLMKEDEGMVAERGQYFRLLYSGGRQLEFEGELLAILQEEMDALTSALGIFPSHTIDVLLMTDDLGERAKPAEPIFRGIYDGRIRLFLGDSLSDREVLTGTVRHEMVHALLHQAGGTLPAWFQEGIAQKLGERPSARRTMDMKAGLRRAMEDAIPPDLFSFGDSYVNLPPDERILAYSASFLFIQYLEDRYGENMIPVLVSDLQQGFTLEEAARSFTREGITDLQADFLKYLKEEG